MIVTGRDLAVLLIERLVKRDTEILAEFIRPVLRVFKELLTLNQDMELL